VSPNSFQAAFDFLNEALFDGALPAMTLVVARHPHMHGFYCPAAWCGGEEEEIDELRLNPDVLALSPRDALSVLVHKMCHYWQFGHGTPSLSTRHDGEWAQIMREVGLEPHVAARAGVCLHGQKVGHSVIADGPFDRAFARMPREILRPWLATRPAHPRAPRTEDALVFSI